MDINYQWYKKHNICVQCHEYTPAPNRVRCEVCLAKDSERHKGRNTKSRKEHLKKLRAERKSKGLCIDCGKPICRQSKCYCIDCRIKALRRNKKTDIPIEYRVEKGLCKKCGKNPIIQGKKLCKKCYDTACNNLKAGEEGRREYREYIKKENRLIFNNY